MLTYSGKVREGQTQLERGMIKGRKGREGMNIRMGGMVREKKGMTKKGLLFKQKLIFGVGRWIGTGL
jgi:hypothetical protein